MKDYLLKPANFSFVVFSFIATVLFTVLQFNVSKAWVWFFDAFDYSPYLLGIGVGLLFILITKYITSKILGGYEWQRKSVSSKGAFKIVGASFISTLGIIALFTLTSSLSLLNERKQLVQGFYSTVCAANNPISEVRNEGITVDLSPVYLTDDYITMLSIMNTSEYLTDKAVRLSEDSLNARIKEKCNKLKVKI